MKLKSLVWGTVRGKVAFTRFRQLHIFLSSVVFKGPIFLQVNVKKNRKERDLVLRSL